MMQKGSSSSASPSAGVKPGLDQTYKTRSCVQQQVGCMLGAELGAELARSLRE